MGIKIQGNNLANHSSVSDFNKSKRFTIYVELLFINICITLISFIVFNYFMEFITSSLYVKGLHKK